MNGLAIREAAAPAAFYASYMCVCVARGFELVSTVGSQMTYPSSIAGLELRISRDLGRLGDRGILFTFQHTLQLPSDRPLCSYIFQIFSLDLD